MKATIRSKSDQAFRQSVRPLGLFFLLASIMMIQVFFVFPDEDWSQFPFPFLHSVVGKKLLIAFSDVLLFYIGFGLLRKWKIAWYTLFVYIISGTIWIALGAIFDYFPGNVPKYLMGMAAILINGGIAIGIYFATRPAFVNLQRDQMDVVEK